MEQPQPSAIRDLLRGLGGPKAVALRIGVTPQAVTNWQMRAFIPQRHHLQLWRMAQAAGLDWQPPGTEGIALSPAQPEPQQAA